ncbi:porin [Histophilus somni]|uniref:porin n=1 Tax=Histophilus somni TaxID=731 RepID=UPI0011D2CF53|nr:porin [Histophilus somni]QEH14694.1 porin [Histophilus somni]QEH21889.1 porin [Histophilus somni]
MNSNKQSLFTKSFIASALALSASYVNAAAFQIAEVSSSGLGRAYAGEAAIADNAAVVATNPALMSLFKTKQFSMGGVYVQSRININGEVNVNAGLFHGIATGKGDQKNIVPSAVIPNMYFVAPINDKFAVGAGMNVNFGLQSKYKKDYDAGVLGGTTALNSINLNLSGSYRISKGLSIGAGLNAVYAKAKIERQAGVLDKAIDTIADSNGMFGGISIPSLKLLVPIFSSLKNGVNADTTLTQLQDNNAWGFGWNIGAVYEFNQGNRIGIAYHSKVDINFKDDDALSYQFEAGRISPVKEKGGLTLHLPDYFEISGFHQLTEKFAMHYSYKYTKWSRLQSLHATYDNGKVAFHKDEKFHDSSRIALGATYDVNDKLTLRAGIAYDESADHPSASIPDTDRTWYSLGATYNFTPNLSVDVGFAHLRGKKQQFRETQNIGKEIKLVNISADYQSTARANLYGLNLNYRF